MAEDPHALAERRSAARRLLLRPMLCAEREPDAFREVRRHQAELDRWFTQRLGYRLHVDADTARLHKMGPATGDRRLRLNDRFLTQREHVVVALVLAAVAAGPAVISLRDLVAAVRSAAADVEISLGYETSDRRALVTALRWCIDLGLLSELHDKVDSFAADEDADAILALRADRIALLPTSALIGARTADELVARTDREGTSRAWLRTRLVEDPVVYRDDVTEAEWSELRRRLGEESATLADGLGLVLEVRAEGVAAIDPTGALSMRPFPRGGTVGHCSLLALARLSALGPAHVTLTELEEVVRALAEAHASHWSKDADRPDLLAAAVLATLGELRLVAVDPDDGTVRVLPAAARFLPVPADERTAEVQESLW